MKMKLSDYQLQSMYCKYHNTPEGRGCDACPAEDKTHCADALINLCGKLIDSVNKGSAEYQKYSRELDVEYGMTPYAQLGLFEGFIDLPA